MALVAYDYSSSEESEDEGTVAAPEGKLKNNPVAELKSADVELPPVSTTHFTLPAPRSVLNGLNIEEEDDEFLRKKAVPVDKPLPKPIPTVKTRNGKVQIMVPSLKDFKEDNNTKRQPKSVIGAAMPNKPTGLLGMLPKPKSETSFAAPPTANAGPSKPLASSNKPIANRLIPDSVANRPRSSTADSKQKKVVPKSAPKPDSDDSGDEDKMDFFSLHKNEELPEISANEINVMVAKRAARMAEMAKQFQQDQDSGEEPQPSTSSFETNALPTVAEDGEDLANERALSSLIGGNKAKRARLHEVNIIDINSTDIVPSKEDFLRRKLQDETGFVPTGHLTGDWSCTSKRKSHITYLASKAQDNAQELEAMWATNRQSRRQTQSKYGF